VLSRPASNALSALTETGNQVVREFFAQTTHTDSTSNDNQRAKQKKGSERLLPSLLLRLCKNNSGAKKAVRAGLVRMGAGLLPQSHFVTDSTGIRQNALHQQLCKEQRYSGQHKALYTGAQKFGSTRVAKGCSRTLRTSSHFKRARLPRTQAAEQALRKSMS